MEIKRQLYCKPNLEVIIKLKNYMPLTFNWIVKNRNYKPKRKSRYPKGKNDVIENYFNLIPFITFKY